MFPLADHHPPGYVSSYSEVAKPNPPTVLLLLALRPNPPICFVSLAIWRRWVGGWGCEKAFFPPLVAAGPSRSPTVNDPLDITLSGENKGRVASTWKEETRGKEGEKE